MVESRRHLRPGMQVAIWYFAVALLVFSMVVLGGLVRLTGSGLSIVEWNLIMGAIPPLGETAWLDAFAAYQQFPEFQQINHAMTLSEFKFIFLMEYGHRLLGRVIGLVFMVPFVWFLKRRYLSPQQIRHSIWLLFLGGAQGFMGWYMVKSGLVDVPRVSHFRLAAHLLLALIVFSFSLQLGLRAFRHEGPPGARSTSYWGRSCLVLLFVQICLGAWVSGLHAGNMFNSFPKMGDQWLADAATFYRPFWRNFIENPVMIQFMHRCGAFVVSAFVVVFAVRLWTQRLRREAVGVLFVLVLQIGLGISTLILYVPIPLASAHQVVAFLLWASLVFALHRLRVEGPVTADRPAGMASMTPGALAHGDADF